MREPERELCEICGSRPATMICPRCRRLVCDRCFDKTWMLCAVCAELKSLLERDYLLQLRYIEAVLAECRARQASRPCSECPLVGELLFALLKRLRAIEREAKVEGMEEVSRRAAELRKEAERLAAAVVARLLLSGRLIRGFAGREAPA